LERVYTFRPHDRLRVSSDYQRVKEKGRRARSTHFAVNFIPNGLRHHRLGLVVQKRFWNAVWRNRIKRLLREWFRLHKHKIPLPGLDIVVVARQGSETLNLGGVTRELLAIFEKQVKRSS
jgi:ribonuclease P protein component